MLKTVLRGLTLAIAVVATLLASFEARGQDPDQEAALRAAMEARSNAGGGGTVGGRGGRGGRGGGAPIGPGTTLLQNSGNIAQNAQFGRSQPNVADGPASGEGKMLFFDVQLLHLYSRTPIAEAAQQLTADGIEARIAKWQEAGLIARSTSGRIASVEHQQGYFQTGEDKLMVAGHTVTGGGRGGGVTLPQMNRTAVGAIFLCSGYQRPDGKIQLNFGVEESWYEYVPGDTRPNFQDDLVPDVVVSNPNIVPEGAAKRMFQLNSTMVGNDGQVYLANVSWTKREDGHHGTILVITPRVAP